MDQDENLREQIIKTAEQAFAESGLKFRMQDIAEATHISKKTIYTQFPSKEELLLAMLQEGFGRIALCKQEIMNSSLPGPEKLRQVMIALPDDYRQIDFGQMDDLRDKFPTVADALDGYLQGGWESVEELIRQGIAEGWLREEVDISMLEAVFVASLKGFLEGEELRKRGITYQAALNGLMDLLMRGILKN